MELFTQRKFRRSPDFASSLGLAVVYFLIARASLFYVVSPEGLAVIWPPSGIMVALLLLISRRKWFLPLACVFAANVAANYAGHNPLTASFGLAVANTVESVLVASLLIHFVSPSLSMNRFRDVLGLILLGCGVGTALSALIGAAVLSLSFGARFADAWWIWWITDGISILVITPAILNLSTASNGLKQMAPRRVAEAVILSLAIAMVTWNICSHNLSADNLLNQKYVLMPLLAWSALRFKPLGTSLILAMVGAIGAITISHNGLLGSAESIKDHALHLQLFLAIACSSTIAFAAILTESKETQKGIRDSEIRYRALFETNADGILIADSRTRRFSHANPTICRMLGYSEAELRTMHVADIHPKEMRQKAEATFDANVRGETAVVADTPCLRRDGTVLFADINMAATSIDGEPSMVGLFRDITERKKMEEKLFSVMQAVEATSDAIGISDAQGHHIYQNKALSNLFGYATAEELRAAGGGSVVVKDPNVAKAMFETIMSGKPWIGELEMVKKNGCTFLAYERADAIKNDEGEIIGLIGIITDITVRKNTEEQIKKEKIFSDSTINSLPGIFYLFDANGRFLRWNKNFEAVTGFSAEEIAAMSPQDFFDGEEKSYIVQKIQETFRKGQATAEAHLVTKSGKRIFYFFNGTRFASNDQHYLTGMGIDLTERRKVEKELETQNRLLRTLIDNIPDSIYVKDAEGRKILTNRSDLNFMGAASEADVLGKTDAEVYPKHLADLYNKADQHVLREGVPVINLEEVVENPSGVKRCLLTSKIPLKDLDGRVTGLVGIGRDITERKSLEVKLLNLARYDTLTQIPNRALFFEKAAMGLAHTKRSGLQCAVLFIDIDHFKNVNDIMGHFIGDELIKDTAVRLIPCIRETDVIARLGGDEFVILLNDLKDTQGIQQTAERIREQFNTPRVIGGSNLFVTVSIGIATYPNDGDTVEELLKNADTAMYAAKVAGRNTCCFFNHEMNKNAVAKMQLERGLRDALEKKELALFYQPIVSVSDGKVRGFEALLRWFKGEDGLIYPDQFIPLAEETGLIIPIGEWVIHEACRFNKRLIDHGYGNMVVSVNVSVAQLRRANIVDIIRSALEESGMPAKLLEIEVTESMFIHSLEAAIEILNHIKALGAQVSLDDFGTGYSSLVHLQVLPIANLKIDRLFIKEITKDSDEEAMIPAIIDLAHKLNLNVVAEGVENDTQLKKLLDNHCDYYQGYLLSKPMPENEVLLFLERMNRAV